MKNWFAAPYEKRAIRAVAAASEKMAPLALHIEVGERTALNPPEGQKWQDTISTNLLTFSTDENEALDKSDLHQPVEWTELDRGIPLVEGKAIVDFYVYRKEFGGHGDLLTNVQAHVDTIEGKPRLWKITGTGMPPVTGDALAAFMKPPKKRGFGTVAYNDIEDWRKRYAQLWLDARAASR